MTTGLRSSTGCWTCRLRRKKCDELRPFCNRCTKLCLPCDGYGDRPAWMDGGVYERQRAVQTQQVIREMSAQRRRKSLSLRHRDNPIEEAEVQETITHSTDAASVDSGKTRSSSDFVTNQLELMDFSAILGENMVDWQPDALANHDDFFDTSFGHASVPNRNSLTENFSLGTSDVFTPVIANTASSSSALCSTRNYNVPLSWSLLSSPGICDDEANLLVDYFENLDSLQFPIPRRGNRGWLHAIIMRSRAAYWATISLSACRREQDASTYHKRALAELPNNVPSLYGDESPTRDRAIDHCFALQQLVFLEIIIGEQELCSTHIHAAASLLSATNQTYEETDYSLIGSPGQLSATDAAHRFLTISLPWCNAITLCCSLKDVQTLDTEVQAHEQQVKLINAANCEVRLLRSLRQITGLARWKEIAKNEHRLSIVELVNRATVIENELEAWMKACSTRASSSCGSSPCAPDPEVYGSARTMTSVQGNGETHKSPWQIQYQGIVVDEASLQVAATIFASAARVQLHITVAGARRYNPDISTRVQHTIEQLCDVSNSRLLCHLSWPICVAGCLAVGEERSRLMNVLCDFINASQNMSVSHKIRKVCQVLHECWRLVDEDSKHEPDWVAISERLSQTNDV